MTFWTEFHCVKYRIFVPFTYVLKSLAKHIHEHPPDVYENLTSYIYVPSERKYEKNPNTPHFHAIQIYIHINHFLLGTLHRLIAVSIISLLFLFNALRATYFIILRICYHLNFFRSVFRIHPENNGGKGMDGESMCMCVYSVA